MTVAHPDLTFTPEGSRALVDTMSTYKNPFNVIVGTDGQHDRGTRGRFGPTGGSTPPCRSRPTRACRRSKIVAMLSLGSSLCRRAVRRALATSAGAAAVEATAAVAIDASIDAPKLMWVDAASGTPATCRARTKRPTRRRAAQPGQELFPELPQPRLHAGRHALHERDRQHARSPARRSRSPTITA